MIKKLIRQEVFKKETAAANKDQDLETPRSNQYEGGSSDGDIES
jgi:hypothetical protein